MQTLPKTFPQIGPAVRGCLVAGMTKPFPPPCDVSWEREREAILAAHLSAVALEMTSGNSTDGHRRAGVETEVFRVASLNDATKALSVEFAAREPLQALQDHRIPFVIIKGPAVARFYTNPDTRFFADIDIFVAPRDYPSALSVLSDCGFTRRDGHVQPWPWFERVCVEGANFYDGRGGNIDVHHHIAPWVFSQQLRAQDMVERSEDGYLAGVGVKFASAADGLAIACLHVLNDLWKEDPSLQSWRDVFTLMQHLGPTESHRAFVQSHLEWFEVIAMAAFDDVVPRSAEDGDRSLSLPMRKRWRLQAMGWNGDTVATRHRAGWALRLPAARAVAFTAGGLVPSRKYVHTQYRGYRDYWRASVRNAREAADGKDAR